MHYNSTPYFYILNLQGDVIRMVDGNGNTVASYEYDPYGRVISATGSMADINPLRYRGYYYDQETKLYHLWSRYYDPQTGRFINADEFSSTGQGITGYNMFAYCGNDPINRTDSLGQAWWHWAAAAALVVASAVAVVATAGGAAAAIVAVTSVANGVAVASTSTTIAAGVFIGTSTALAVSAYSAAIESDSAEEFAAHGESALIATAAGGLLGGLEANALPGHTCFVAGTLVQTKGGLIPIEQIACGSLVWAWNQETDAVSLKEVVETYVSESYELIHVFVGDEEIITTPTHPFYSPVKGWTEAVRLRAGDMLVLLNGEYVVVEKVQHELLENPVIVYNFQVEGYHTYYVSNAGVLVHNSCNHTGSWNAERRNNWKNEAKTAIPGKDYGAYVATESNMNRMSRGLAPIGWDGYSVHLHHWNGIANDFYNYSPVSRTLHNLIHSVR